MNQKKNKWIAFLLALTFGFLGLHRFYLRQNGLGILYIALALTGISFLLGLIDAFVFFFMSYDRFNYKYNKEWHDKDYRHPRRFPFRRKRKKKATRSGTREIAQYKERGILHFKAFELEEAATAFRQALDQAPNDVALHFNLACTYARLEETDAAWMHLHSAVSLGFNDFEKIDYHPALAYLRIQPSWIQQRRELQEKTAGSSDSEASQPLFQQLHALSDAHKNGILSEEEFQEKKEKLLQKKGSSATKDKNSDVN